MRIITKWEELGRIKENITVVIGNFDGVHCGHQQLLKTAGEVKGEQGVTMLLTFNPHPVEYFTKKTFHKLTPKAEMKTVLEQLELDYWLDIEFNEQIADLSPNHFLSTLTSYNNIKNIVVGFNFKFGKQKEGSVEFLREKMSSYNYKLFVVPAVQLADKSDNISSTLIRNMLKQGKLELANTALGRNYTLIGRVVHGKKMGRKLGFPTANIEASNDKLIPADGVYAGLVNNKHIAAVSIGLNPSFNGEKRTIEIYILNYSGEELYDEVLRLELTEYLRPQIKFSSKEELVSQINKDIAKIQEGFIVKS